MLLSKMLTECGPEHAFLALNLKSILFNISHAGRTRKQTRDTRETPSGKEDLGKGAFVSLDRGPTSKTNQVVDAESDLSDYQ
jgi:hypothetical protein